MSCPSIAESVNHAGADEPILQCGRLNQMVNMVLIEIGIIWQCGWEIRDPEIPVLIPTMHASWPGVLVAK